MKKLLLSILCLSAGLRAALWQHLRILRSREPDRHHLGAHLDHARAGLFPCLHGDGL